MSALTYLQFLAVAVVPVALVLLDRARARRMPPRQWAGVGLMVAVAVAYTTPWDNYLVARGVWWYGEGTVAARIWHAPAGEYLFIVLQTVVAALWLYFVLDRTVRTVPFRLADVGRGERVWGAVAGATVGLVGLALLRGTETYYLGAILAWAGPVLALQWGFAPRYLWLRRRLLVAGVGVPTAYFCAVDRVALELGVWVISPQYTTGLAPGGLPVEEGAFFFVTTLFVVQGLVLLEWVLDERAGGTLDRPDVDTTARRAAVER
jgi:lycopene cyclase domain-containing protein